MRDQILALEKMIKEKAAPDYVQTAMLDLLAQAAVEITELRAEVSRLRENVNAVAKGGQVPRQMGGGGGFSIG